MSQLIQQLTQLPCFDKIIQVHMLYSGLSAQTFKVQTQQGEFFAKHIDAGLYVSTEVQCNLITAAQGLTPNVIYYNKQWLVSDFIQGENIANLTMCLDDKLDIVTSLMVSLHQQSINLPPLNIKQTITDLLNPLYYQPTQIILLRKIAHQLDLSIQVKPNYVCHGDANFSNVLLAKNENNKPYLVDFECACKADIEFDLAMLLAINNLDKSSYKAAFYYYESHSTLYRKTKINTDLVMRYLGFSFLINALWFYNRFQQNSTNTYYNRAKQQFSLFDNLNIFDAKLNEQMR